MNIGLSCNNKQEIWDYYIDRIGKTIIWENVNYFKNYNFHYKENIPRSGEAGLFMEKKKK